MAANKHLWDLRREQLPTVPSWLVSSMVFWQRHISFPGLQLKSADYHRLNSLTRSPSTLPQTPEHTSRRAEILSMLRDPERPYVVISARESAQGHDLRNRDINEFEPAIHVLIHAGYNVVRVTARTRNPLQLRSRHVLDFQVEVSGQPGDELALVSGSSFVISTTTGIDCLALAYRRPVLYVDTARLFYVFLGTELATFQMPLMLDSRTGETLKLQQLVERKLCMTKHSDALSENGVLIANSKPDELANVVREYLRISATPYREDYVSDQSHWRDLLSGCLGDDLARRHGDLQAFMHPASMRLLL